MNAVSNGVGACRCLFREQLMLCGFWFDMSVDLFVKTGKDTT